MNDALTCGSPNSLKRSGWASDKCLKRFGNTWFISALAYGCSKVSSFTFIICFVSKEMPYFTVLCLLIPGAFVSSVWSIALFCCHIYRLRSNLGSTATYRCKTAAYEIPIWAKLWYCTVWNIIYTSIFYTVHPYSDLLLTCKRLSCVKSKVCGENNTWGAVSVTRCRLAFLSLIL